MRLTLDEMEAVLTMLKSVPNRVHHLRSATQKLEGEYQRRVVRTKMCTEGTLSPNRTPIVMPRGYR